MNDHDKIAVARKYFELADQGRPEVLELFHEDAEIYFPKFGIGSGRESLFEMVYRFKRECQRPSFTTTTPWKFIPAGSTSSRRRNLQRQDGRSVVDSEAAPRAVGSATSSDFARTGSPACTSMVDPDYLGEATSRAFAGERKRKW